MRRSFKIRMCWLPVAALVAGLGCSFNPAAPKQEQLVLPPGVHAAIQQAPFARVPDFSLMDANPNSASYDQAISPHQHFRQISAWYFGHST